MFLFCTLFHWSECCKWNNPCTQRTSEKHSFCYCCFVVFGVFVCLQHYSALLHLVYHHDCILMLCPERSVESATQGEAPAACGQDLQDVGLLHKGNTGIW